MANLKDCEENIYRHMGKVKTEPPYKRKHALTTQPSDCPLEHAAQRNKNLWSHRTCACPGKLYSQSTEQGRERQREEGSILLVFSFRGLTGFCGEGFIFKEYVCEGFLAFVANLCQFLIFFKLGSFLIHPCVLIVCHLALSLTAPSLLSIPCPSPSSICCTLP